MGEALRRMRHECNLTDRHDLWGIFEARILAVTLNDAEPTSMEALAARYGLENEKQASNLLMTAKRAFARHMRGAVAEYETDSEQIDSELADLRQILGMARR